MIQEGNGVRFAREEFAVMKFNSDPFIWALRTDFRSQNLEATASGISFFRHLQLLVRALERQVEGRERGHTLPASFSGNKALYWAQVDFLLWNYKALEHLATKHKQTSDEQLVKLFDQLYQTGASVKAEILAEPQMSATV